MGSHYMRLCSKGHILSQCRCPGPKTATFAKTCACPADAKVVRRPSTPVCQRCGGTNLFISGDGYECSDCNKHDSEQRPDTITTTRSALEKVLREAIGFAYLHGSNRPLIELHIKQALDGLEGK